MTGSPSATATPAPTGPVGIIAIGHSALTGENSDPGQPGRPAPQNSWATGTNPEVDSIYQRLIKVLPETEGHVGNTAQGGASANALKNQARRALATVPNPRLVIIETIDNDIRCDGTDDQHVPEFGTSLASALKVITDASPDSKILITTQRGRPATEAAVIATNPEARASFEGSGMCDGFSPTGDLVEENLATLTGIIESYESEQARVCASLPQCSTDDGALTRYVAGIDDLVQGDWNHLNVLGLARVAETMWPTVAALLELPE